MAHQEQQGVRRRAVIHGAAWSVPAVTVVAAAPAFAATPPNAPNLSTSQSGGTPTRNGNTVTVAPTTFVNTGGVDATGLTVVMSTTGATIDQVYVGGTTTPISAFGVTVSGLGTNTITMNIPASLGTVAANGGTYTSPISQDLLTSNGGPITVTTTVTAANGGVPFVPPVFTV